jgi:hypothetical protein
MASPPEEVGGEGVALPEEVLLLLRELDEADAAVARLVPSAEEVREQIDAAEKLAQSEAGTPAKTEEVAQKMLRKWKLFVCEHGVAYGLDTTRGPTSEFVLRFQTWGFRNRSTYSPVGLDGMSDSWGERMVPYLLPKFVLTRDELGYSEWRGLEYEALIEKCRPLCHALKENWKRLKVSHVRAGTGNGRTLKKERWCDGLLFKAQDLCMAEKLRVNRAITRLSVMGFIKVTCSRGGAFSRDWFDRAGKQVRTGWRGKGRGGRVEGLERAGVERGRERLPRCGARLTWVLARACFASLLSGLCHCSDSLDRPERAERP